MPINCSSDSPVGSLHLNFIVQNAETLNSGLDELRKAGFESVNHHRPIANISFALNYYFHGLEEKGYHLVNIFIHLLSSIMLFYFVKTTLNLAIFNDKYQKS
ncbi:hypothetical protein ACFL0B_10100, partial [Thermodesulfobacteriota bacterium]